MKRLAIGTVVGVILAVPIIYWLQPLNTGAVGLIVTLAIVLTTTIAAVLFYQKKQ